MYPLDVSSKYVGVSTLSTLAVFTDRRNDVLIIGVMLLISGETSLFSLHFRRCTDFEAWALKFLALI
jgi:hypothetical protein